MTSTVGEGYGRFYITGDLRVANLSTEYIVNILEDNNRIRNAEKERAVDFLSKTMRQHIFFRKSCMQRERGREGD